MTRKYPLMAPRSEREQIWKWALRKAAGLYGINENRKAAIYEEVANAIERGDYKQTEIAAE